MKQARRCDYVERECNAKPVRDFYCFRGVWALEGWQGDCAGTSGVGIAWGLLITWTWCTICGIYGGDRREMLLIWGGR